MAAISPLNSEREFSVRLLLFHYLNALGNGMTFLQIGGDDSTVARRLQGSDELADRPLGFSIAIKLVPVESMVGMDEVSSAPSTKRTTLICAVQLGIGLALSTAGLI